jgi:GR25 family glycosyltransferase involved in LPS biosynthesis
MFSAGTIGQNNLRVQSIENLPIPSRNAFIVINLKRRQDRWRCVKKEFDREGVDFVEEFEATDGEEVFSKERRERTIMNLPIISAAAKHALLGDKGINNGHLATFISHVSAIRTIAVRELKLGCIFEDDVSLKPGFLGRVGTMYKELPKDWDILLLSQFCHQASCEVNRGIAPITKHLRPIKMFFSGAGYCLNSKSAKKILSTLPCEGRPGCTVAIDGYMGTLARQGFLKAYTAIDLPVIIPQDLMKQKNLVVKDKDCFSKFSSDIVRWWRPGSDRHGLACVLNRREKTVLVTLAGGDYSVDPESSDFSRAVHVDTVEQETMNVKEAEAMTPLFHHELLNAENAVFLFESSVFAVVSSDLWRGVSITVYNNGKDIVDLYWRHSPASLLSQATDVVFHSLHPRDRYESFLPNKDRVLVGKLQSKKVLFVQQLTLRCDSRAKKIPRVSADDTETDRNEG